MKNPDETKFFKLKNGARVEQVDEHPDHTCALFIFELEEYPEPKALSRDDFNALYSTLKSYRAVAQHIGASEAFVRQTCKNKKYKHSKSKKGNK